MISSNTHRSKESNSDVGSRTRDGNNPGIVLFFIALGLFGLFTVEFSVVGVMPQIVDRYDVTIAQAGLLVSIFAAVLAVLGPVVVIWLSRYESKKVLVGSLAVFSVCSLLSAWAPNFLSLMALRIPSALMLSAFFSVAFATVVSLYPPEQAARASSMALLGESAGLVFGAPVITLIAATISYEASFYFCAAVCGVAAIGLQLTRLPDVRSRSSNILANFRILKSAALWLAILFSLMVFGAIYSVYSYTVEYLSSKGFTGENASLIMLLFGMGGLIGTYVAGRVISRSFRSALFVYPVLVALSYLMLTFTDRPSLFVMAAVCLIWGAVQMGLVVATQFLVTSAGRDEPQFATSLFVSSSSIGITAGAALAGTWITAVGAHGAILAGWLFCAAALISLVVALPAFRRSELVG